MAVRFRYPAQSFSQLNVHKVREPTSVGTHNVGPCRVRQSMAHSDSWSSLPDSQSGHRSSNLLCATKGLNGEYRDT